MATVAGAPFYDAVKGKNLVGNHMTWRCITEKLTLCIVLDYCDPLSLEVFVTVPCDRPPI